MPGLDHEVHESVRMKDNHRAGCWNREPFKEYYWARTVDYDVVPPLDKWIKVKHKLSTECRYDQRIAPEHCEGCIHINTSYDAHIRKEGT